MPKKTMSYFFVEKGIIYRDDFNPDLDRTPVRSEIAICRDWLARYTQKRRSALNPESSYSLKHRVERDIGSYVSNGAFIRAAAEMGYRIQMLDQGPNAQIGLTLYTPDLWWQQESPTGFSKWLFNRVHENSNVGDLAMEAMHNPKWPRRAHKFASFWHCLQKSKSRGKAFESLCDAWLAYTGTEPPAPDRFTLDNCEALYDEDSSLDILKPGDSYQSAPWGMTYLYVLFDREPRCCRRVARYVGQSADPGTRLLQHINSPGSTDKTEWIGGILHEGREPMMAILCLVSLSEAITREKAHILAFGEIEENRLFNRNLT